MGGYHFLLFLNYQNPPKGKGVTQTIDGHKWGRENLGKIPGKSPSTRPKKIRKYYQNLPIYHKFKNKPIFPFLKFFDILADSDNSKIAKKWQPYLKKSHFYTVFLPSICFKMMLLPSICFKMPM